jgi:hypothetical protein
LWSELERGDGIGCLDPGENLGDTDLSHGDGDLNRHVSGYAEAAVRVGDFSVGVTVSGGYDAANHDEGNTQQANK